MMDKHHQFTGLHIYQKAWDKSFVLIHFLNFLVLCIIFIPKVISEGELIEDVFFGFKFYHLLPVFLILFLFNTTKLRETIRFRKNTVKFGLGKYSYIINYKEIANFRMTNNSLSFQVGDKNFRFELIHHETELIDELKEKVRSKGVVIN